MGYHYTSTDIGNAVKSFDAFCTANSGAPLAIIAAGTGDATAVTGQTIDRLGFDSGVLVIHYLAALTAAKTLSIALEYQLSSDNSSWDTAVAIKAATVVATGAGNVRGVLHVPVNLSGMKRYIRFNFTPDLSHTSTDTAVVVGVFEAGGFDSSERLDVAAWASVAST